MGNLAGNEFTVEAESININKRAQQVVLKRVSLGLIACLWPNYIVPILLPNSFL